MNVQNAVALVTGANRGLGLAFAEALLERGASKVYAAVRDPGSVHMPGVVPVRLDVTSAADITAAVPACPDVTLLINNAGILRQDGARLLDDGSLEALRAEFETNVVGPLELSRAFAPVLARQGGGAIVNVLSALSWVNFPGAASYSVSKAAAWSLTNGLRGELRAQHTQVLAVHVGYIDTDMASAVQGPKVAPAEVVRQTLNGLEAGQDEVLADEVSRQVKQGLSGRPTVPQ
ncbi:SDR family oxidoreductase (plasmid) [Deinococcus sp. KNUC1210]|uniref:SDR family oxidoreductase n=1 Tax=Deinococcus sp. KNUC1210 TaxID=2917691 RepID=UPI001EF08C8F|nr:SDR family oxidoreductase [Deinococcus sp. KNUC1210]ULH17074.1 SDR family oxidoreductase [Deinococcus sp. KNUC1210]